MKLHPLVFFFLLFQTLHAQTETELLKQSLAKEESDTHRLFLLNELVEAIASDTVWPAYNEQMGRLATSLLNSPDRDIQLKANKYLADYFNNLAYLQQDIGNTEQALTYYYRALKIYESLQDKYGIANALNNIGTIYDEQGDRPQAELKYSKSYALMEQLNDSFGMALALNNLGSVYNNAGMTDSALYCFNRCISIRKRIGDREGLGIALANAGGVYDKTGRDAAALDHYMQSMKIQEETGDQEGIALSHINFGSLYLKQRHFEEAEKHFMKARNMGEQTGNARVLLGAANWLSRLYAAWGKYKPAFEMQTQYKQLTDSIRNDQTRRQTLKKQMQFDFEMKEAVLKAEQDKKDALSKEEITRQKIIRNTSMGGALVVVVSAGLILLSYKKRKEAEMDKKLIDSRMRAISSQMNPHFIFNCMHSIQALVAKQDLAAADNCLVRFAGLIRRVLDYSMQKEISLEDDMETLHDYVALEKMRLDHPLEFTVNMEEGITPGDVLIPPLLIQPVIENAIIHGIRPLKAVGKIVVDIKKLDRLLAIEVSDNGVGRKTAAPADASRKSYGIPLTRERLEFLGRAQKMKSSYKITDIYAGSHEMAGTRVRITLPFHDTF